jgi:protein SHQ1
MFSYLFDLRINEWEHNSVSDQMIGKLAPSLSCMVQYGSVKQALCTSVRRSLCYSLYRQFELAQKVADDLLELIQEG